MTNYLTTEYNVKYHITFTHDDGQDAVFYDDMVIECASPEDAQNIILEQYSSSNACIYEGKKLF